MKKSDCAYEPHLTFKEFSVQPGEQWVPRAAGWTLIQVSQGAGYYLQPQSNQELATGTVLFFGDNVQGTIRASQLGGLSLCSFNIIPSRLAGLITLSEQNFLDMASKKEASLQVFPPNSPMAVKIGELYAGQNRSGMLFRLKMLQFFVEIIGNELEQVVAEPKTSDVRDRLQSFLRQTPSFELLEMNLGELSQATYCTPRHLSRIFHNLVGMSFRDKRAELRLARACELLATSNSKVVEVALESGYRSLSLFNLMFVRRFGLSPSKWRQRQANNKVTQNNKSKATRRLAPAGNSMPAFQQNPPAKLAGSPNVKKISFRVGADMAVTTLPPLQSVASQRP